MLKKKFLSDVTLSLLLLSIGYVATAYADNAPAKNKSPLPKPLTVEGLSAANGHFSRARSYLIEALREFDKGRKVTDPAPLIDSIEWRATVVEKAKDLEVVLAPKGREGDSGVKYDSAPGLLKDN